MLSGSTRRRTGAVLLRGAAKAATSSCGTPTENDAAHKYGAPSAGSAHACHPAGPVSSAVRVRADVQDGAPQDLPVLRRLVGRLPSSDDRQVRPAEPGEGVGHRVVELSVIAGQIPGTDPERLGSGRVGRIVRELGQSWGYGATCRQRGGAG